MGFFSFFSNLINSIFCKIFKQPKERELDLSTLDGLIGTEAADVSTRLVRELSEDSFTVRMYRKGFLTFNTDENGIITGFEFTPPSRFEMTVTGSSGDDVIVGAKHDDTINGADGNDNIDGGNGDDTIFGGIGNDNLTGGAGADIVNGDEGDDTINAGDGDDVISGGAGNDTIDGGNGDDALLIEGNVSDFTFDFIDAMTLQMTDQVGTLGIDTISNVESFAFSDGLFTRAELEALAGGPNIITGTTGNDILNGTADDDIISGLAGDDDLFGNAGNDVLIGGAGSDDLFGGADADVFTLTTDDLGAGLDRFQDFSILEGDTIDLSDLLAAFNPLTDAITDFVRITNAGSNSLIAVDTDGGGDAFTNAALVINVTGLTDEQALVNDGTLVV